MPLKTQPMEEPALNLTPMIDIVLLLVIFFLVGTQFTQHERQYEIDLPTVTDAQPLTALPDEIIVNIARGGEIELNGTTMTFDELEAALRQAPRAALWCQIGRQPRRGRRSQLFNQEQSWRSLPPRPSTPSTRPWR